ncbi:gastrin/cholecystokinin type B receptor-like [Macrobrachium nipponense]|uniref:gastrin/cholecystokinin type B receptor-like n=1 Tax=Macrobrachium nipponense TaxID=159736 RepID=UPI0030C7B2C8
MDNCSAQSTILESTETDTLYDEAAFQTTLLPDSTSQDVSPWHLPTSVSPHDGLLELDYFSYDDINQSLRNGSWNDSNYGNSSFEYEYDYDAALGTFFWRQLVPPLLVYSVTYVVGVVGNVLIIFTIARYRRLKTTTNVFLASLASADLLLILLCIPLKLARLFSYTWTLGEVTCKTLYYIQCLSAMCSVLTLCTMSIERYYAIVYPMRAQYRCTISQAKRLCAGIWLISFFLAAPTILLQVHMEVGERVKAFWCVRDFDSPLVWRVYETYMLVVVLVMPTIIMAGAYTSISCAIIHMVAQRRTITGKGQM